MNRNLFTTAFVLIMYSLGLVEGQDPMALPVDVVFIIDESQSLEDEQQQVMERAQAIFDKLNNRTGGFVSIALIILMYIDCFCSMSTRRIFSHFGFLHTFIRPFSFFYMHSFVQLS